MTNLPIDQIRQTVHPTADQEAVLDDLSAASTRASDGIKSSCPSSVPLTPIGRLDFSKDGVAQALVMPLEERRARHEALHAKVCEYDVNRWQREFLTALRGGREHERFHSYGSNGELTNLETSGARLAPIDQSAESRELERGDR